MLYKKYLKMHLKSSFQYRYNMMFIAFNQILINISEILAVYLLFEQFDSVAGWSFYESLLMMGIVYTVYSFTECFARGYDEFPKIIQSGELDCLLIRPVNIHYQIFGSKIEFTKIIRVILGIIVSIIALVNINIDWDPLKVLVLFATYLCGIVVILGLFILSAGISIYTVENLEFLNIITNGSKELAYYPINIYAKWLTRIFTFIIPIACFNYLPLSYILGVGSIPQWLCAISPLLGMLFIIPCIIFFNLSLRRYRSTGT